MKKILLAELTIAFILAGFSSETGAVIIDFENGVSGVPLYHYEEDGYQIDALIGSIIIEDYGGSTGNVAWILNSYSSIRLTALDGSRFDFVSILFPTSNVELIGNISSDKGGFYNVSLSAFPETLIFDGPKWSGISWLNINREGGSGIFFDVDNISLEANTPIPEPSTFLLLVIGLAILHFYARKIKKG